MSITNLKHLKFLKILFILVGGVATSVRYSSLINKDLFDVGTHIKHMKLYLEFNHPLFRYKREMSDLFFGDFRFHFMFL